MDHLEKILASFGLTNDLGLQYKISKFSFGKTKKGTPISSSTPSLQKTKQKCPKCKGNGVSPGTTLICLKCNGSGRIDEKVYTQIEMNEACRIRDHEILKLIDRETQYQEILQDIIAIANNAIFKGITTGSIIKTAQRGLNLTTKEDE